MFSITTPWFHNMLIDKYFKKWFKSSLNLLMYNFSVYLFFVFIQLIQWHYFRQKQSPVGVQVFLKIFAKVTGKEPVSESLFNKVANLRSATLFKKKLLHRCFLVTFPKFLRTPYLQNASWKLFLFKHTPGKDNKRLKYFQCIRLFF